MVLEREQHLRTLRDCFAQVRTGRSCTVLVTGEAGAGKSSLVDAFLAEQGRHVAVMRGGCDALSTLRPFGPLFDLALDADPAIGFALQGGAARQSIFSTLLSQLCVDPCILVLGDLQWADQATLDLCKFLGRRIAWTHALLIMTFTNDQIDRAHPLHGLLSDLPMESTRRVDVPPLSRAAVGSLAVAAGRSIPELFERTGGNAFLVTELLAAPGLAIPHSIEDSVCARVQALAPEAREVAELASVVPRRIHMPTLEAVLGAGVAALDECVTHGLLSVTDGAVSFRHELMREALYGLLPPQRRRALHGRVLEAMLAVANTPLVNLLHQAVLAERNDVVLRFAPLAASDAVLQGARVAPRATAVPARMRRCVGDRASPVRRGGTAMADRAAPCIGAERG